MAHMKRIIDILQQQPVGESVDISGWLRTRRDSGSLSFLEINDGSCLANLQVIAEDHLANYETEVKKLSYRLLAAGARRARGFTGQGAGSRTAGRAITVIGWADPGDLSPAEKTAQF